MVILKKRTPWRFEMRNLRPCVIEAVGDRAELPHIANLFDIDAKIRRRRPTRRSALVHPGLARASRTAGLKYSGALDQQDAQCDGHQAERVEWADGLAQKQRAEGQAEDWGEEVESRDAARGATR